MYTLAVFPTQQANRLQVETVNSRLSEEERIGYSFYEPQDLQGATEHASPSASRQAGIADRKWEGGFFPP